jgi:hypothetical protein
MENTYGRIRLQKNGSNAQEASRVVHFVAGIPQPILTQILKSAQFAGII